MLTGLGPAPSAKFMLATAGGPDPIQYCPAQGGGSGGASPPPGAAVERTAACDGTAAGWLATPRPTVGGAAAGWDGPTAPAHGDG